MSCSTERAFLKCESIKNMCKTVSYRSKLNWTQRMASEYNIFQTKKYINPGNIYDTKIRFGKNKRKSSCLMFCNNEKIYIGAYHSS